MKIVISGRASVIDKATGEEIAQAEQLRELDGIAYTDDSCCEYFSNDLEEMGLTGGLVRLAFAAGSNQLRVVTEYQSLRRLKPKELKALVRETTGQWSDGIGESFYWQDVRPGVAIELAPLSQEQDLQIEEIDDGVKPLRTRFSPLLKAAETGDLDKLAKLLAKGEDINARDKYGRPVIHAALWKRQFAAASFLLDRGADPNSRNSGKHGLDETSLHILCRLSETSLSLVVALLAKGADVDARDSYGRTPLMWAGHHLDIATTLLAHGAQVNLRDTHQYNEGHTALMHIYQLDVIQLLLDHGADPNIRNDRGLTSYDAALFQAGDTPGSDRYKRWMPAAELLLTTIRQRAADGDGAAQYSLADFHARGVGRVPKDEQAAFQGFEQSARNGCRLAMSHLGTSYQSGEGTSPDLGKAVACFKQAAEQGVPLAMGCLGQCYASGAGVPKDAAEAIKWYRRGAEVNPATAARPYEVYAFRNGSGACRAELGECYEKGAGVEQDLEEALRWYRAALDVGFHHVQPAIERVELALKSSSKER